MQSGLRVQRLGGTAALSMCAELMGEKLPVILPALWDSSYKFLKDNVKTAGEISSKFVIKHISPRIRQVFA